MENQLERNLETGQMQVSRSPHGYASTIRTGICKLKPRFQVEFWQLLERWMRRWECRSQVPETSGYGRSASPMKTWCVNPQRLREPIHLLCNIRREPVSRILAEFAASYGWLSTCYLLRDYIFPCGVTLFGSVFHSVAYAVNMPVWKGWRLGA